MDKILSILFILFFSQSGNARGELDELRTEVIEHRNHMSLLAPAGYEAFPDVFPSINLEHIRYYIRYHDLPKVLRLSTLRKWGYAHSRTILSRLSDFRGIHRKNMNGVQKTMLEEVIRDLNEIENRMKEEALRLYGFSEEQVRQLKRLEHWIDVTDVGMRRREELGIRGPRYDGARYLRERHDTHGAKVSMFIEDHYWEILEVYAIRPRESGSFSCSDTFAI